MGSMRLDISGLKQYQKDLQIMQRDIDKFFEACAKELAARLLAKVIRRTPVGDSITQMTDIIDSDGNAVVYKRGKHKGKTKQKKETLHHGGTLRRGWTARTESEAESGSGSNAVSFAEGLTVERVGGEYQITIINPVSYASYVEYGHRQTPGRYVPQLGKQLKRGWVDGQFMMTISAAELKSEAPAILERKLQTFLRGVFNGQ